MGVPEEDEVGHVDVEAAHQPRNEVVPLPHCVGADAVDQEQGRLGSISGLRDPAVHDRAVAEVGGCGFEARGGKGPP